MVTSSVEVHVIQYQRQVDKVGQSDVTDNYWHHYLHTAAPTTPSCDVIATVKPNTHTHRDATRRDATQLDSWVASASAVSIGF